MASENAKHPHKQRPISGTREAGGYDPFVRGRHPVGVRTRQIQDTERDRVFPCEIWYPAAAQHAGQDMAGATQDVFTAPMGNTSRSQMAVRDATPEAGTFPLIVFSHSGGGDRRQSTALCTHLASHGYLVAAIDHSERVAASLARKDGETDEEKSARWDAVIANRVPDIRCLLDHLLNASWDRDAKVDPTQIGILGHSFGGWTALAAVDVTQEVRAVVALAPAGASQRRPGILPVELAFAWGRDVPTLYLAAENDTSLPLAGMHELFERTPATKRMVVLRRADHMHFMDETDELHEAVRTMQLPEELAQMQREMLPITELCSGEQAAVFAAGLTLCHFDATLRTQEQARRFWIGDVKAELVARGVDAIACNP